MPEGSGAEGSYVGDRVVVRCRLGAGGPADWRPAPNPAPRTPASPTLSDVTGFLVDDGDPLLISRNGITESIPRDAITSVRLLTARPVRNTEIRNLEYAAARAWPGIESEWIDGWLVRAGGGFTRRANSAVPADRAARADADTLRRIGEWYAARGLPVLLAAPDRLVPTGHLPGEPASGVIHVLTRPVDGYPAVTPGVAVDLAAQPSPAWIRAYGGERADAETVTRVVSASDGPVTVASVTDGDGTLVGTGRASVTTAPDGAHRLGVTALWTAPGRRRSGIGDAIMSRLIGWGTAQGATVAYVQTEVENRVAGNWYRRRGFALHHTYEYLRITSGTP